MQSAQVNTFRSIFSVPSIPLGFGCGGLLGRLNRSESLRLLETAMDSGISYFDTARMYGLGGAEGILGNLTPRNRKRMIIASKAGILPPHRSYLRRLVNRGVRLLHGALPKSQNYVQAPDVWQPQFGVFRTADLRQSIETSLKELRTDYLDVLLLHECTEADAGSAEVLDFLQGIKKLGLVREFGLATGIEETIRIVAGGSPLGTVLQIPNSIWNSNVVLLPPRSGRITITHSCFGSRFHALFHQMSKDDLLAKKWASLTKIDPHDKVAMAQLFLAHALRSNPDGIVLFFSSKPQNIRSNVKLLEGAIDASQIGGLEEFVRGHGGHISSD